MKTMLLEKYASFSRTNEPVQVSIPFKKGELPPQDVNRFVLLDAGKNVKAQTKTLANWADGSVKWLKVNFLADIPGNQEKQLAYGFAEAPAATQTIHISNQDGRLTIDNGCLKICLNGSGKTPFHSFAYENFVLCEDEIDGPYIVDETNQKCKTLLSSGWEIAESGEVLVKLTAKGTHASASTSGLDFEINLYIYADTPWIELKYRIIHRMPQEKIVLKKIALDFHFAEQKGTALALATSNYRSDIRTSGGEKLSYMIDADYLLNDANEQTAEVFYGTFFADWNNRKTGGLCAVIYQAYQNFPKAFSVDESNLSMQLLPEEYGGITFHRGMAKTHSFFLHFHDANANINGLNQRSLMLQSMDIPILAPDIYKESGIYEHIFVEQTSNQVEKALQDSIDSIGKAYGLLHWGDCPDVGYTEQGRGGGEPVWTNNEYDFPFMAMQMYVRKSQRRFLDHMITASYHWADIDICHYDESPLRMGAQIIHSAEHVSGYVEISHEWVEGLFAAYYATGEPLFYDSALGVGHNIMRHLDEPKYHQKGEINARETGWALRALVALYRETNDAYWLTKADFIVSHFVAWKERYGGWFAPYTDHTVIRVPFMISIAVGSLMRYYRIKPNEQIKDMILGAVDDLISHCLLDNGLFYYKELPSLRLAWGNTIVLEALANAYELTGDVKYLQAGMETFLLYISTRKSGGGVKKKIKDGVLLTGPGPKIFAQSFFPVTIFYDCLCGTPLFQHIKNINMEVSK